MHALQKNRILKGSGLQPARVMAFGTATQVADKTPTKVAAKKATKLPAFRATGRALAGFVRSEASAKRPSLATSEFQHRRYQTGKQSKRVQPHSTSLEKPRRMHEEAQ
jgi:hypothetical protein